MTCLKQRFDHAQLKLFRALSLELGFPPTRQMLSCIPGADGLMEFRDQPLRWKQFRETVHEMWSEIPAWTATIAADGTALDSVPERVTYEAVTRLLPKGVKPEVHPATVGRRRADLLVVREARRIFIEVAGMLHRHRAPYDFRAERYLRDWNRKLTIYAAHGFQSCRST